MEVNSNIFCGDAIDILQDMEENCVDLIVTSPPYADQRKDTYGGIPTNEYVEWFLPISKELLRVLKPTGTFILNIKERVKNGERSTYVMELVMEMRKQGCYGRRNLFGIKKIVILVNGPIVFEMPGKDSCSLIRQKILICTRMPLWFQWEIGQRHD